MQGAEAVEEMAFQKGFTNLSQALAAAEEFFLPGGREKTMATAMMTIDSKPSFFTRQPRRCRS